MERLLPHVMVIIDELACYETVARTISTFFLNRVAPYFQALGEYARAKQLLERGIHMLASPATDNEFAMKATMMTNLATVEHDLGRRNVADVLHQTGLSIKEGLKDPPVLSIAVSWSSLGTLAEEDGRDAEALKMYERALPVYQAASDYGRTADCLLDLCRVCLRLGREVDALQAAQAALESAEDAPDAWSDAAAAHNALARIYSGEGAHARADEHAARAEAICERAGPESIHLARALATRGLVWLGHDSAEGVRYIRRALAIFAPFRKEPDLEYARVQGNLGSALTDLGEYDDALIALKRSHADLASLLPEGHHSLTIARALLLRLAFLSGDHAVAQELLINAGPGDIETLAEAANLPPQLLTLLASQMPDRDG